MLLQIALALLVTLTYVVATPPPGYEKKEGTKQEQNGPKYTYGYKIADDEGSQEKQEQRDGVYALGRYYVHGVDSKQSVEYLADDWGFHPYIEYSNNGPHSKSSTRIAFGEEAVKALRNSKNLDSAKSEDSKKAQQLITNIVPTSQSTGDGGLVFLSPTLATTQQQSNVVYVTSQGSPSPTPATQTTVQQENTATQEGSAVYVTQKTPPPTQTTLSEQSTQFLLEQSPYNSDNVLLIPNNVIYPSQTPNAYLVQVNDGAGNIGLALVPQQQFEQGSTTSQQSSEEVTFVNNRYESSTAEEQKKEEDRENNVSEEDCTPEQGSFGEKINAKLHVANTEPSKLIENTKNLVTGQDVLNINDVLHQHVENVIQADLGKSTTVAPVASGTENVGYYSTEKPATISLSKDPIVVAELDENKLDDEERYYSTTKSSVETESTVTHEGKQTTVVVTPRPVSTSFLAPITAAVQLQEERPKEERPLHNSVVVDIQKSVPYYIGKFEYVQGPNGYVSKDVVGGSNSTASFDNVELGKTILQYSIDALPSPQPLVQHLSEQGHNQVQEGGDQKQEPGQYQYQISPPYQQQLVYSGNDQPVNQLAANLQQEVVMPSYQQALNFVLNLGELVPQPIPAPYYQTPLQLVQHQSKEQSVVKNQGQKQQFVQQYAILQQQREVQKQVADQEARGSQNQQPQQQAVVQEVVTKYYPVPQPYPVEKVVTKPVEKIVEKKVPVPVEVKVPVPQPYVVEVPKPYPVPVTKLVPQPYPVTVTQTVKVPVPTPVEVKVPHPVPVEVPKYIERPYPIYLSKDTQQKLAQNPYIYAPSYQVNCDDQKVKPVSKPQQYAPQKQAVQQQTQQTYAYFPLSAAKEQKYESYMPTGSNFYHTIHLNDYIGLKPPKPPSHKALQHYTTKPQQHVHQPNLQQNVKQHQLQQQLLQQQLQQAPYHSRKYRNPRHSFGNLRIEYGFMPPLIPSLEIDEHGNPIEKPDKD